MDTEFSCCWEYSVLHLWEVHRKGVWEVPLHPFSLGVFHHTLQWKSQGICWTYNRLIGMPWTLLESAMLHGVTWSWYYLLICAFYSWRGSRLPCQNTTPSHHSGLYRSFQPFSTLIQYLRIRREQRTQLSAHRPFPWREREVYFWCICLCQIREKSYNPWWWLYLKVSLCVSILFILFLKSLLY